MRVASSLCVLVLVGGIAAADSRIADDAFARGRTLMKQKKYAEACAAFEQSYQLDPSHGTLFNLADCEVDVGKLASALKHYSELARTDTNADRRSMSQQLAKGLAARVPKLRVTISDHVATPSVELDGHAANELVGVETPIDLGAHELAVSAPGFAPWHETVTVDHEAVVSNIVVKLVSDAPSTQSRVEVHAEPAATDSKRQIGQIAVIGGSVLVVGGLVFGGLAYSQWQHAQSCNGCDRVSESHTAIIRGDVSTVLVITGAIVAGAGGYLWKTSSGHAEVTAAVGPGGGTVALVGAF